MIIHYPSGITPRDIFFEICRKYFVTIKRLIGYASLSADGFAVGAQSAFSLYVKVKKFCVLLNKIKATLLKFDVERFII